ncbi:hypothetical protein GCM10027162_47950 [Streptomyces incanus]
MAEARAEVAGLLAADGPENVRALQRAIRNAMTEHAGGVRDEEDLRTGLTEPSAIEKRMEDIGVHPDIAGHQDLAHAFGLKAAPLAARVDLVRSSTTGVTRESVPPVPDEISSLMREVSTEGKLVE